MTYPLGPESHFPVTEDVSEVCRHAFRVAMSRHGEGGHDLIRIIDGREVIGRFTQDRRQILIFRDPLDTADPSEEEYEVEFFKPDYVLYAQDDLDDPDSFIDRRLFVLPDNPYEFFEADEDGLKKPIGRAPSKHYAEAIAYSNLTSIPEI